MKYVYAVVASLILVGVGIFFNTQKYSQPSYNSDAIDILRGSVFEYFQSHTVATVTPKNSKTSELPATLRIDKIKLQAHIEYVGVTSEGAMDVPSNPSNVAWLESGARPGEIGAAVIDGHYGIKDGIAAAFNELHRLRVGDRVSVETIGGEIIQFSVRKLRRYDSRADATDVYTSGDGRAHLNLITCEGSWNDDSQEYPKRLVVFTDRVE